MYHNKPARAKNNSNDTAFEDMQKLMRGVFGEEDGILYINKQSSKDFIHHHALSLWLQIYHATYTNLS